MGFGIWDLGFGVWGLGFGVWGLGFGVWGLGFGVWGLGFRAGETSPTLSHYCVWEFLEFKKQNCCPNPKLHLNKGGSRACGYQRAAS